MDDGKIKSKVHQAPSLTFNQSSTFNPTNITNKAHTEKQHRVKMKLMKTLKNQRHSVAKFHQGRKHNRLLLQPLVVQTLYYNYIVDTLFMNNTN